MALRLALQFDKRCQVLLRQQKLLYKFDEKNRKISGGGWSLVRMIPYRVVLSVKDTVCVRGVIRRGLWGSLATRRTKKNKSRTEGSV